ncbi:MAG: phosphate ABC transporter permease subunit PstC [Nitrospirota bacterium]|jgi:phosphate transport system permease protein
MQYLLLIIGLAAFSALGYHLGRSRSRKSVGGKIRDLHSLPRHYGAYVALWCGIPAFIVFSLWVVLAPSLVMSVVVSDMPPEIRELPDNRLNLVINDIQNLAAGYAMGGEPDPVMLMAAEHFKRLRQISYASLLVVVLSVCLGGLSLGLRYITPDLRARVWVEKAMRVAMVLCSTVAIFTTVGIVLSVLFESVRFFGKVPFLDFIFGLKWSPQIAIRADQVGAAGSFGMVPLLTGTILISAIAMLVAVPVGLMSAIFLSEYASRGVRAVVKPLLEILAGIPTVVYGFFAAMLVAPLIRNAGEGVGLDVSSESALAAGLVMGIMIIPFVSSLSDDVINAVPQSLREGSLGLGATTSETVTRVLLPAALPGIVGSVLLAVSRAIGETMIVVMAAGLVANLTANPLEAVTTFTVQIVTLLVGDQEFDDPKTLSAFALGLVLFFMTLCLNIIALHVVRRYREQYE